MKTMKRDSRRSKKGLVLPVIAAIAICLALLGLGVLRLGFGSRLMATRTMAGVSARAAADAGITRALYELNNLFIMGSDPLLTPLPPPAADVPLGNSNATYSYTVQGPFIELVEPYWLITSIGLLGTQVKTVYATLGVRNLFDYGLIVTDNITLKSNTVVDGYNSGPFGLDLYGAPNAGMYLRIGTTSIADNSIWLGSDTVVTGDVLAGIGGDVYEVITNPSGDADTGPWYNLPEPWQFEPIAVPPEMPSSLGSIDSGNDWVVDADGFQSLILGEPGVLRYYRYDNINVPNSHRLVFKGPVELYVTGEIRLNQGAELFVGDPSDLTIPSSLIVYLDGDLSAGNSNGINNLSLWPRNFRLFGTGPPVQSWVIHNSGDFFGVYYGPNADIEIKAQGEVYGSVSGLRFDLKSGAGGGANVGLHYDHDLANLTQYDTGFGIDRMWEKSDFVVATGP